MRKFVAVVVALAFVLAVGTLYAEEKKEAPKQLVFETKQGNVTYDHAKHAELAKGDCKACHPTPFKQEKGDLGYKEQMHKKAEAAKTSCAACHVAGGKAFETKGNCAKCHKK